MFNYLLSAVLLLTLSSAMAAEKIRSYSVFTDTTMNPLKMNIIADRFEVVKKLSPGFEVYVQEKDVAEFLKLAPKAKLLELNIHPEISTDKNTNADKYRKFAQVEADLKKLALDYKNLATLETYGVSSEGRNLYALKISTGESLSKPKIMITAATHGDELITTEVLFALTEELLAQKDARLVKILESRDLYIIPVVSPDSFEKRDRYVEGQDPNRSYPWPENINNRSVSCIKAMMDYTDKMKFTASLDMHAYGRLVMYPWGYTRKSPDKADEVVFSDLVNSMARDNNYKAGQISTTIYVAKGSSADYFYWKSKTKAIAVEVGTQKIPDYSKIPSIVNESREMMWTFLENIN
jgi:Zinc carboxypeptidase